MSVSAVTRPWLSAVVMANPLVRVIGRDEPAWMVLAGAATRLNPAVAQIDTPANSDHDKAGAAGDYAQIDPTLDVVAAPAGASAQEAGAPVTGVGYSGLSPTQRWAFLHWLKTPVEPAPRAFQWLYLANLEVRLLEPEPMATLARQELVRLWQAPTWDAQLVAPRLLLACWLAQDSATLGAWLAHAPALDADLLDVALGMQARMDLPLGVDEAPAILAAWHMAAPAMTRAVLALRLSSLATTLEADLLQHALQPDQPATPWRCLHRDLRMAISQPRVRARLEPLLVDMLAISAPLSAANGAEALSEGPPAHNGNAEMERAHLIIEFRESRSEYFDWALRQAKKQSGFQQLMDEDRHIVYRAPFRRNETRRFWNLWECVQGWTNSRVYCQGRELEKWQVYSGSLHMR